MSIINSTLSALTTDKKREALLRRIDASKDAFLRHGISPFDKLQVEPEVAESWIASQQAGVNPYSLDNMDIVGNDELSRQQNANRDLLDILQSTLERYGEVIEKMTSVVFFADSDGVVLYLMEGGVTNAVFRQFGTRVGGVWSEEVTGTSAVALCVKHRTLIQLVGPEHYQISMQDHLTTAAPIFDGDGRFLGALATTTLHNKVGSGIAQMQPYMLGWTLSLASSIENEYRLLQHMKGSPDESESTLARMAARPLPAPQVTDDQVGLDGLIGPSAAMAKVRSQGRRAAESGVNTLLIGEPGVGKHAVARAIASSGTHRGDTVVTVSCSAIPEASIEVELFGCEPVGASPETHPHRGLLEQAAGGVLLIEEVADIPRKVQGALLSIIEKRSLVRVGGTEAIPLGSLQIIATTEYGRTDLLRQGRVREDLLTALSVISIIIPPLRSRREDIRPLIDHLLEQESRNLGKAAPRLSKRALELLCDHPLPGNVRQLDNAMQYGILMAADGVIEEGSLPLSLKEAVSHSVRSEGLEPDAGPVITLREAEYQAIMRALAFTDMNIRETARILDISRSTLYRKLAEYGISYR